MQVGGRNGINGIDKWWVSSLIVPNSISSDLKCKLKIELK